jgi:hypothetical protein
MSAPTAQQLMAKRHMARYGRTIKLLRNAVATSGLEGHNDGTEDGVVPVRGTFKDKTYPFPKSGADGFREADEERAPHREWTFKCATIDLEFMPTIDDRVIDGDTNYAILRVTPQYHGEVAVTYTLVLKPVS